MGITIRKRKNSKGKIVKRFEAIVYHKGKVLRQRTFETYSQAESYMVEEKKRICLNRNHENWTLEKIITTYKKTNFQSLRKSSQQARLPRFKYILESPLSEVEINNLNDNHLDHWVDWLENHDTNRDPQRKSFRQEIKLLTVILNWYRENYNSQFISPILKRHRSRLTQSKGDKRVPDYYMKPGEVNRWLARLNEKKEKVYYYLAKFMVLTGCRLGEACGLMWDAIDENFEHVRIIRTLSWDYKTKEPYFVNEVKSINSRRVIKLPNSLQTMFRELKNKSKRPTVFVTKKYELLKDNRVRENFNRAFKELGLPWHGTHICRHTSATLALLANQDITTVQALLGHSSIKQTQEYAKIVALQRNSAPSATEQLLEFNNSSNDIGGNIKT